MRGWQTGRLLAVVGAVVSYSLNTRLSWIRTHLKCCGNDIQLKIKGQYVNTGITKSLLFSFLGRLCVVSLQMNPTLERMLDAIDIACQLRVK